MAFFLAPLALLLERLVGYPDWLFRRIGHPVTWMGALITWLELRLNTGTNRRARGMLMLALLLLTCLAVSLLIIAITRRIPFGWVLEAVLATSLLAQRALGQAVKAVADGLTLSLAAGRHAVSHIVGRDTEVLDESGVAGAAIESLAESTSDGVVAPLFWLIVFGLPGIVLYKAINTADSMVGHRNERFAAFGWASAVVDDVVNWIPARLSALLIAGACFFMRRADPEAAWTTALRDARKHASPNAGWPEAAFAGALGIQLGGPRSYAGETHALPSFGEGRKPMPADILPALILYWISMNILLAVSGGIALALARMFW